MSEQPEQEALQRAVADIGYLHCEFSVEVTTADGGLSDSGEPISRSKIVIVRNEVSKARQAYRPGPQHAWLDAFRRDLTAGAFN